MAEEASRLITDVRRERAGNGTSLDRAIPPPRALHDRAREPGNSQVLTTPTVTWDSRPGLDPRRLIRLMREAIDRVRLELAGRTVLTEAASGAYVVTPVLAAMAGAQVSALAAATSYATANDLAAATTELARLAGVTDRVHLLSDKSAEVVSEADIVTNSGQVRPIDAAMVTELKPTAVIPLMYESWEYRPADLDLNACRARRIPVAGTNESHPAVNVVPFAGPMAVKQLHDAGIAVYGSRIVLLCDNAFGPFIAQYLRSGGAEVEETCRLNAAGLGRQCDAVLLAVGPASPNKFAAAEALMLGRHSPGAVLIQFWGDADREALAAADVPVWPPNAPKPGHMGVLPSAIGPEPVIRLQSGGLKVGELLTRGLEHASPEDRSLVQLL